MHGSSIDDAIVEIGKLENGYVVAVVDPEINAANNKKGEATNTYQYKSPWRNYSFETAEEVVAFLDKVLPKLQSPDDSFETSFAQATAKLNGVKRGK